MYGINEPASPVRVQHCLMLYIVTVAVSGTGCGGSGAAAILWAACALTFVHAVLRGRSRSE